MRTLHHADMSAPMTIEQNRQRLRQQRGPRTQSGQSWLSLGSTSFRRPCSRRGSCACVMDDRAWEPQPLLRCGGRGARPHACRDVGRCRHRDSPPRHRALEQDTVLPILCACPPCFFNCLSHIYALQTGWHRSCSATAYKKQPLRTTRRKAAYGLIAREALPPQTLPVLYTFRRRRVMNVSH